MDRTRERKLYPSHEWTTLKRAHTVSAWARFVYLISFGREATW